MGTLTIAGELVAAGPGTSVIAASVVNTGTIAISHGQMEFLGPLSGAGAITISAGGILDLDSSNTTTASIGFGTGGGLLYLYNPSDYDGTIGGFASGDAVELNGFAFSNNGTADDVQRQRRHGDNFGGAGRAFDHADLQQRAVGEPVDAGRGAA